MSINMSQSLTKCQNHLRKSLSDNGLTMVMKRTLSGTNSLNKDKCPVLVMPDCVPSCQIQAPKKPHCDLPRQKVWENCDKLCLPCCEKVKVPLTCDTIDMKLNNCKKEEYRLPSYSECNKHNRLPRRMKECCYWVPICNAGDIRNREIKPLLRIKDRQARVLGRNRY